MDIYLALLALLFILSYMLAMGIRCYQVSGFRFYLIGYALSACMILVICFLHLLIDLQVLNISVFFLVLAALVLPSLPQAWLEAKAQKDSPALWDAWVDKAVQARASSRLDKLLLPRRIRKTGSMELRLPNGNAPRTPIELMQVLSSQLPALYWFLIGSGGVMIVVGLLIPSHPNPFILPTLVFAGLSGLAIGSTILFFSRKPRLAFWLMYLSLIPSLVFLYLLVRTFTFH